MVLAGLGGLLFGTKLFGKSKYKQGRNDQVDAFEAEAKASKRAIDIADSLAADAAAERRQKAIENAMASVGKKPSQAELDKLIEDSKK